MKQQTLAMAADQTFENYRKPTRRDEFLKTMEAIVPWAALCEVIEPHYPKAGNGRPPIGLERMLRIHFIQHWFNLADLACEEALYDSASLRRFVGIDLGREPVPDSTTITKFRKLLNDNNPCHADIGMNPVVIDGVLTAGKVQRQLGPLTKILSEIGPDLSRFASVKHFCSWLGLCPGTKISGGKMLSAKTKRSVNRVRQALKMAAMSLSHSDSALGAFYRRMCARMDKPSANTAVAHKLARMLYFMLTRGEEFVDQGQQRYEEQQHQRSVAALKRRATTLGFALTPVAPGA